MRLLESRAGICLYLLLPRHWVWTLLSDEERALVESGNRYHDTHRADFVRPETYCHGHGFDSEVADEWRERQARVIDFLDRVRPARVLEVGPGSGHLTRTIVTHPAVRRYVGVDINPAFIEYLAPRLERLNRRGLSFELIAGEVADVAETERFDAVILLSTVHHIPDRVAFFAALKQRLRSTGRIFACDPTHYLLRWRHLLRKVRRPGYLREHLESARQGRLGTHAMCQWAEYCAVSRRTGLQILRCVFSDRPGRVERWRRSGVPLGPLGRWFAQEITVEFGHQPPLPVPQSMSALLAQLAATFVLFLNATRNRW